MTKKCYICGATVPDDRTVCPYCGNNVAPILNNNWETEYVEDAPTGNVKCDTCGATVPNNAIVCPYCGNAVTPPMASEEMYYEDDETNEEDVPSGGLNILSFLIPIAGWVLYFSLRDKTPNKAKACNTAAWIGLIISVVIEIFIATAV